jgi:hypothetical protein
MCEAPRHPGISGTDITHKSVLNITPSVKMEHGFVSNIGAGGAWVSRRLSQLERVRKSCDVTS